MARIDVEVAKRIWQENALLHQIADDLRKKAELLGDMETGAKAWRTARESLRRLRDSLARVKENIRSTAPPKGFGGADKALASTLYRLDRADIEIEAASFNLSSFERTPSSEADSYDPPRPGRSSTSNRTDFVRRLLEHDPRTLDASNDDWLRLDESLPFLGPTGKSRTLKKLLSRARAQMKKKKTARRA